VIVDNLDFGGTICRPDEAQTPLFVDANAVLALSIILKRFESVPGRNFQIIKHRRPVELRKFAKRDSLDVHPATHPAPLEEGPGVLALETLDRHDPILT